MMLAARIAVLGCGSIGRRHIANLLALGAADLVVFDPVAAAREQVAREFGVPSVSSSAELWVLKPDVALIASPTSRHLGQAREAVEHGCHIFVEKPLADGLDGCAELIAECSARKLTAMVACNMRFHPGPAEVKRLLDAGTIGTPLSARLQTGSYLPGWRPSQDYRQSYSASAESGGAVLDCIHELDLALWYFGAAKLAGAAGLKASAIGLETDGLAEILLRHAGGVLSSVNVNFIQRDYRRGCQIVGTDGTIYWDFKDNRVTIYGPAGALECETAAPPDWKLNQMYRDEMSHFLTAAESAGQTCNPLEGGFAALQIALEARRKVRESYSE